MLVMKKILHWMTINPGFVLVFVFLVVELAVMNDYGLTWDFHFHFFGGGKLLGYSWQKLESRPLPYVEPDPRNAWTLPYGPLMSIPPVASFLILYQNTRLLAFDNAYNLPIILWGAIGVAVLYLFLDEAFGKRVALLGALFLALTPRYVGDLHNNMKDVPSAVSFALNIWLLWRLAKFRKPIDLLWAILAFALAFNVKINSVFIPVVFGIWLLLTHATIPKIKTLLNLKKPFIWFFVLAPLAAFWVWAIFWQHPIAQIIQAYSTFGIGTNNIEVLLNGSWYCSGSTVPWYYPYWYMAITTPLPILLLFLTSIAVTIAGRTSKLAPTLFLFLLWFFIPLTRYFLPTIGVIDGVRHFEEVLFPIAALAAVTLDILLTLMGRVRKRGMGIALLIGIMAWLGWNIVSYHPYEITYFNELVGGVHGAFSKYDLDYWGTSQKAAIKWVNSHAPQNAKVHIVMAADVAGMYLRSDLLPNLNKFGYDESDFVVFLNRQSFFYRFFYAYEYLLRHTPTYTVSVHNTPLTWVFDNRTHNTTPRQTPWWQAEDPCILPYWHAR